MNKKETVEDIVEQLRQLQLRQDNLITRLAALADSDDDNEQEVVFNIGDSVTIDNPSRFQANQGTIVKIGKRITVLTSSGSKIIRSAQHLTHR